MILYPDQVLGPALTPKSSPSTNKHELLHESQQRQRVCHKNANKCNEIQIVPARRDARTTVPARSDARNTWLGKRIPNRYHIWGACTSHTMKRLLMQILLLSQTQVTFVDSLQNQWQHCVKNANYWGLKYCIQLMKRIGCLHGYLVRHTYLSNPLHGKVSIIIWIKHATDTYMFIVL